MRLTMDLSWQKLLIITLVFGTGAVIGSQAFPKTVNETQTLPAQFQDSDCIDVNTMETMLDTMLTKQILFEKQYCYDKVFQDENGASIIIGDCMIPQ